MTSAKCYSHQPLPGSGHPRLHGGAAVVADRHRGPARPGAEPERAARRSDARPRRPSCATIRLQIASREQIDKGRLMPIVPEMRAIWDAMRPCLPERDERRTGPGRRGDRPCRQRAVETIESDARMNGPHAERRLAFWFLLPVAAGAAGRGGLSVRLQRVDLADQLEHVPLPRPAVHRADATTPRLFGEPEFYRIFGKTFAWTGDQPGLPLHAGAGRGAAAEPPAARARPSTARC